ADHLVGRGERLRLRVPHEEAQGEGVEEEDRRPLAPDVVFDLRAGDPGFSHSSTPLFIDPPPYPSPRRGRGTLLHVQLRAFVGPAITDNGGERFRRPIMEKRFQSYEEFWPYYVAQHRHPVNRALHVLGSTLFLVCGVLGVLVSPGWLLAMPVAGYSFAWIGHFFFERNKPATFTHPLWSLRG